MSIDSTAAREGEAISKSRAYQVRSPRRTKASLKAVPPHMRPSKKKTYVEPEPIVPTNTMSEELIAILHGR